MMPVAFFCTFSIVDSIDPVVSDRNTMSGFGGIGGVCTTFVIVTLCPDSSVLLYEDGSTPDPAATPTPMLNVAAAVIASTHARAQLVMSLIMLPPPCAWPAPPRGNVSAHPIGC